MQAIVTKYIGPTNYRCGHIKATCAAQSLTIEWEHALNSEQNHTRAAKLLAEKLTWDGFWIGGGNPDQRGNCYTRMPYVCVADAALQEYHEDYWDDYCFRPGTKSKWEERL